MFTFGIMRIFILLSLLITFSAHAQKVTPILDFSNFFKTFQNGFFRTLEFQPIKGFKYGDNILAYVDNKSNLRVFEGDAPINVANVETDYRLSDDLMTWRIGETLNLWDHGNKTTLTYWAGYYEVKDSLVVFENRRYNSLNVYLRGQIYTLSTAVATLNLPEYVGENIVVFKDAGEVYKVFWEGEIYEIGAWNRKINFAGGTDMVAFNDPIHGTFTMFEKGEFVDVQSFFVDEYKVGNDILLYTDLNGNLNYYSDGVLETISNFKPRVWDVVDKAVIWTENNTFYTMVNHEKKEIVRYIPSDYKIKNEVIAFRDLMGGVSVYINGEMVELTQQRDAEYSIHGNGVLVELFNKQFIFYVDGKKYRP